MQKFGSLLFVLSLLFGCSDSQESKEIEIPLAKKIDVSRLEEVEIPPVLYKEQAFVVTDNFFISNSATPDTLFRVFDRETLKYLGGFGTEGDGPDDYRSNASGFRGIGGDTIQILGQKVIKKVLLKRGLAKEGKFSEEVIERVKIPGELYPWNSVFQLNDSVYAGRKSFRSGGQASFVNLLTKEVGDTVPYPRLIAHIPESYDQILYQPSLLYSYKNQILVSRYPFFPMISVYHFPTNELQNIRVKADFEQLRFEEIGDGRNLNLSIMYSYYNWIAVSDNHIYASYHVYSGKDSGHVPLGNKELHVFDFEGNLVYNMRLEEWINNFAIAPDDKHLYFWHENKEDRLYRYSLEGLL